MWGFISRDRVLGFTLRRELLLSYEQKCDVIGSVVSDRSTRWKMAPRKQGEKQDKHL